MALTLNKLPWYAQLGLFVAMSVAGVGAFYYYYEMPARAAMEKQDKQLKTLRADRAISTVAHSRPSESRNCDGDGPVMLIPISMSANRRYTRVACRKRRYDAQVR